MPIEVPSTAVELATMPVELLAIAIEVAPTAVELAATVMAASSTAVAASSTAVEMAPAAAALAAGDGGYFARAGERAHGLGTRNALLPGNMPTDISTSEAFVKQRTEQTRGAQAVLSTEASWVWPEKTLAQWDADLEGLDGTVDGSLKKVANAKKADMLAARGLLDARFAAIKGETLLTVSVMRVRSLKLPGLREIVDQLSARGDSRRVIMEEAEELEGAWEEWEEQTAAPFSPAPGKTLAAFTLLLEGGANQVTNPKIGTLKKNYTAALNKWRSAAGLYNALLSRLEDECVSWYAEATGVFPSGTPHGDMIRGQITTSYTPVLQAEPPAAPTSFGVTQANPGDAVTASADAVTGATLYKIFARPLGSSDEPVLVGSAATLPTSITMAPGDYEFTMTVTTAAGESAPTAPVTLTVD